MAGAAPPELSVDLPAVAEALGHRFADPELLVTALRHRSWSSEHGGESNERLEFLGDAVLGLVVSSELYRQHPDLPEGRLTEARKHVVSASGLAPAADALGLGDALLLGRGEAQSGGRHKPSLLENAFEACMGAVFLDGGLEAARQVVLRHLGKALAHAAHHPGFDHKSRLQEWAARHDLEPPTYRVRGEGPEHERRFQARVLVAGHLRGTGTGRTKKQAEQAAAEVALGALDPGDPPVVDTRRGATPAGEEADHA